LSYIDTVLDGLPGIDTDEARKKLSNRSGYRTTGGFTLEGLRGDALALSLAFSKNYEIFLDKLRSASLTSEWLEREILRLHRSFVDYYAVNEWVPQARALGDRHDHYDVLTVSKASKYNGFDYAGVIVQNPDKGSQKDIDRVQSSGAVYTDNYVRDYALDFICSTKGDPVVDIIFPTSTDLSMLAFCTIFPLGAGLRAIHVVNGSYEFDIQPSHFWYAGINVVTFPKITADAVRLVFSVPNSSIDEKVIYLSDILAFNATFSEQLIVEFSEPQRTVTITDPYPYRPAIYKPEFVWWDE